MSKSNHDDNLKNMLESLVAEHGIDTIVRVLSQLSRKEGHAAKFDREDHHEADGWYQAESLLLTLSAQLPAKKGTI